MSDFHMGFTIADAIRESNSIRQFAQTGFLATISGMEADPIRINRVERLRAAVNQTGGPAAFARQHEGVDPTYVSQLLNGHRGFGEKAARKMEELVGWARGYLDTGVSFTPDQMMIAEMWPHLPQEKRAEMLDRMAQDPARYKALLDALLTEVSRKESEKPPPQMSATAVQAGPPSHIRAKKTRKTGVKM